MAELVLTKSDKQRKSTSAVYGHPTLRGSVRVSKTSFPGNTAPDTITVIANFAEPKRKETREERKARLAALPKPTLAEKVAKQEAKLAKLRAKLESTAVPA